MHGQTAPPRQPCPLVQQSHELHRVFSPSPFEEERRLNEFWPFSFSSPYPFAGDTRRPRRRLFICLVRLNGQQRSAALRVSKRYFIRLTGSSLNLDSSPI